MPLGQPIPLPPPKLGIRADVPPYEIPAGYFWRSTNVLFRHGRLRERAGLSPILTAAIGDRISGGFTFKDGARTRHTLVATQAKWYELTGGGGFTDISGAFVGTAEPENPWRFVAFPSSAQTFAIGTNFAEPPQLWDGVAPTISPVPGNPPVARDVTVCGNFVILGNIVEGGAPSPSALRISGFNDPSDWTSGHVDLADTNDDIVAVRGLSRTTFAIYKDASIYVGTLQAGLFPFSFELIARMPGPCSPSAVVAAGQVHYYIGQDGRLYRFDGLTANPISTPVDALLQNDQLPSFFASPQRARCWAGYNAFDQRVWFFYVGPKDVDPYRAVAHHLESGELTLHDYPYTLTAGWEGDDASIIAWDDLTSFTWDNIGETFPTWDSFGGNQSPILAIGAGSGQVYRQRYDEGDHGVPIDSQWELPLKPWLGMENTSHFDGIENFFEQRSAGATATLEVGVSEALAEPVDPDYTIVGYHDTTRKDRQMRGIPNLDARFWSIRFTIQGAFRWLGAMAAAWPEAVAQRPP
jgi:hypothetical protein